MITHRRSGSPGSIPPRQIAFDIDGVVADTMTLFLDIARQEYGVNGVAYKDITCYALEKCLDIDADIIWDILIRIMDGRYTQELKPMPGAPEVLQRVSQFARPLLFVTARPYLGPIADWIGAILSVEADKLQTIATGSFRDKADVLLQNGIRYFIEDRLETCYTLKEVGIEPILFQQPWNREAHPFVEVSDWYDLEKQIQLTEPAN